MALIKVGGLVVYPCLTFGQLQHDEGMAYFRHIEFNTVLSGLCVVPSQTGMRNNVGYGQFSLEYIGRLHRYVTD